MPNHTIAFTYWENSYATGHGFAGSDVWKLGVSTPEDGSGTHALVPAVGGRAHPDPTCFKIDPGDERWIKACALLHWLRPYSSFTFVYG